MFDTVHKELIDPQQIKKHFPKRRHFFLIQLLRKLPTFRTFEKWHHRATATYCQSFTEYLNNILAQTGCQVITSEQALDAIPLNGPTVVVANHPFGCLDGLLLAQLLLKKRPDVKLLTNQWLTWFQPLRHLFIGVDVFSTVQRGHYTNLKQLRRALEWLKQGGLLVVFPAGEVASWQRRLGCIVEPAWSSTVTKLIKLAQAQVVTAGISGQNSWLFHAAGLLHPRLRTLLLMRELRTKNQLKVNIDFSQPFSPSTLATFKDPKTTTALLRVSTECLLTNQQLKQSSSGAQTPITNFTPVATAQPQFALIRDINALPSNALIYRSHHFAVYLAQNKHIPHILHEIGRLREIAFRAEGMGSGHALDLDQYDEYYQHMFVWDEQQHCLVGAWRFGLADEIIEQHGTQGLYLHESHQLTAQFIEHVKHGIEIGRSFIRPEYQSHPLALSALWCGLGRFLANSAQYRYLFGLVSIRHDFNPVLIELMIRYLRQMSIDCTLRDNITAKIVYQTPLTMQRITHELDHLVQQLTHHKQLAHMIKLLGHAQWRLPPLIKHYLNVNALPLTFSVDPEFANCVDILMLQDIPRGNFRTLSRYFGKLNYATYMSQWSNQLELHQST
ncbi:MAG: GNAT family N-acetyltransferase [Gammaproteobacteria bacterium]